MAGRIQIFNGRRSGKKIKGKKRRAHGNAGGLNFLFNGGKGAKMSKKRKGRKKSHPNPSRSRRHYKGRRNTHHLRHRHNVGHEGVSNVLIEGGGGALAAGLGSHLIAESFLAAWNSGFVGYAITALIGGGISWVGGKFIGKRFFYGGLAGTVLAVGYRVVEDMGVTPAKSVAADVRDAQANAASSGAPAGPMGDPGRRRLGRMGTVVPFPFNVPQTYQVVNGQLVPVGGGTAPAAPGGGSVYAGQAGLRGPRTIDRRLRY